MKKTTKGALAAAAAAALLMGGVGTHASWSDGATATGTALGTGHLGIADWLCGDWLLDNATFAPTTDKLIPGDLLTRVCTFTLKVEGKNLQASLAVDVPALVNNTSAGDPVTGLVASGTFTDHTGQPVTSSTTFSADEAVTATLKVAVPDTGTVPQDLSATLDTISVTASQS